MAGWRASGKADLPLADRERAWDGAAAEGRVRAWAGGPEKEQMDWAKYRQAFFAYDDGDSENFGAYKLGFADVIDGELRACPRGIFACAGGRGVERADLPEEVKAAVRRKITAYYRRMAREFEDDMIMSPFEEAGLLPLMERKTLFEVREVTGRLVTGFASVFGNVDDGGDLVEPGAYVKTLQERGHRLRWLWQHENKLPPIATIHEIGEVGREELPVELLTRSPEATGGLRVKREYLDTPRGNEVLEGIQKKALAELSIGYDAIKSEPGNGREAGGRKARRILKEIRLWEMSDVNWGMNEAAANAKALLMAGDTKSLAHWLESRIHLSFTEVVDDLFGYGRLTREERIALSNAIGLALDAFNQRLLADDLAGVRGREQWDEAPHAMEPAMPMQMAARQAAMRRKLMVLQRQLELV